MERVPLHSVVVPIFDEEQVLDSFYTRVTEALSELEGYEIVFVDDGSTDATPRILSAYAEADSRVRYVRLSRNFGHQIAITAGIDFAAGDTVTTMDGDLQHPPEVVPQMIDEWRKGADIVFAVKQERKGETWAKRVTARAYYRTSDSVSETDIPLDVSDFRLMSRRACDGLKLMREQNRYLRGLVGWMGLQRAYVEYDSESRHAGQSKYSPRRCFGLRLTGCCRFQHARSIGYRVRPRCIHVRFHIYALQSDWPLVLRCQCRRLDITDYRDSLFRWRSVDRYRTTR